jgi:hypothetical protein
MDIYISYGMGDHYRLSKSRKDSPEDMSFESYQELIGFLKGDSKDAKRIRAREVTAFAQGFSPERLKSLEEDIQQTGMKNLKGVIANHS